MKKIVLCTGFHRSGTSLAAQMMSDYFELSENLMGASMGNPDGHFEDLDVVSLHDSVLTFNQSDWRNCEPANLLFPDWAREQLVHLVQNKLAECESEFLLIKDPRATLFLSQWLELFADQIHIVFCYRHWASCAESLLKRHSRDLLCINQPIAQRSLNYDFWSTPELAFNMWSASNKVFLDIAPRHNNWVIVSQENILRERALPSHFFNYFNITPPAETYHNYVKESFSTPSVKQSTVELVPQCLQHTLNLQMSQLNNLASGNVGFPPIVTAGVNEKSQRFFADNYVPQPYQITSAHTDSQTSPYSTIINAENLHPEVKLLLSLEHEGDILAQLKRLRSLNLSKSDLTALTTMEFARVSHYEELYFAARQHEQLDVAELAVLRALLLNEQAYLWGFWGDICELRGNHDLAFITYNKGVELNQNNLRLLQKALKLSILLQRSIDARRLLVLLENSDTESKIIAEFRSQVTALRVEDSNKQKSLSLLTNIDSTLAPLIVPDMTPEQLLEKIETLPKNVCTSDVITALSSLPVWRPSHSIKLYNFARQNQDLMFSELFLLRALLIGNYPYLWGFLGDIASLRKFHRRAKHYYKISFERNPESIRVLCRLIEASLLLKEFDQVKSYCTKLSDIDPDNEKLPGFKHAIYAHEYLGSEGELYVKTLQTMAEQPYEIAVRKIKEYQKYFFKLRDNEKWLTDAISGLSRPAAISLLDNMFEHFTKLWSPQTLITELLPSHEIQLDDMKLSFASQQQTVKARIAVCLHVYYLELVPQILEFLQNLHEPFDLFVTCRDAINAEVKQLFKALQLAPVNIQITENQGRDIGPWLCASAQQTKNYELVCKLHTKSSTHSSELKGWRLFLLDDLLGSREKVVKIIENFDNDAVLGAIFPNYFTNIMPYINWTKNYPIAEGLCEQFNWEMTRHVKDFPAGSMFWYRPAALKDLLEYDWRWPDFPDEKGQQDGTIMHAIERLVANSVEANGFTYRFVDKPFL